LAGEQTGRQRRRAFFAHIPHGDLAHHQVAACPLTEQRPVFFQIEENPGAYRAESGQTYAYFAHDFELGILPFRPSFGNALLALPFKSEAGITPCNSTPVEPINQPNNQKNL
jgi:hypothetical protein